MDKQFWIETELKLLCMENNIPYPKSFNNYRQPIDLIIKAILELGTSELRHDSSYGIITDILDRLYRGYPLTPIYNTEDDWTITAKSNNHNTYKHNRFDYLYKYVNTDGTEEYIDVGSFECVKQSDPNKIFNNSFIANCVCNNVEGIKVTFPYYPNTEKTKIYYQTYYTLTEDNEREYDLMHIQYALSPIKSRVDIDKYFTKRWDEWVEITKEDFDNLKKTRQPQTI